MTSMTKSAISLDKIQAQAPGLVSLAKTAAVSLEKKGLEEHRAAVYLALDHSGSMKRHYASGAVQKLSEQALGLSVNLDDDGIVPVIYFGTDVEPTPTSVGLDSYQGIIDRSHSRVPWGWTNTAAAIRAVADLHAQSGATVPGLVLFQTDGNPRVPGRNAEKEAEHALKDVSDQPLFFSFVGYGDEMGFLRRLDQLRVGWGGRKVDNASRFETGDNPLQVDDATLYDGIMHEYPTWLDAARRAGILR